MTKLTSRLARTWLLGFSVAALSVAASSCGGGSSTLTMGSYCSRIGGPFCNREIACGNLPSSQLSYCTTEFQSGCCGNDGTCSEAAPSPQAAMELETIITECTNALSTENCADLAAGDVPVACGGTSTDYYVGPAGASVSMPKLMGAATARRLSAQP
ncbi:MAG TPA: hypothetical protein VHO06_00325 [Polyangia bacterium]|nr:hypothetical protein [Polyangia bacterium]